jgi:hypothetical protein
MIRLQIRSFSSPASEVVSCSQWHYYRVGSCHLQKRDHWWCILVAKYGTFLFTEIGAVVITDYTGFISSRRRSSFSCGLSPFSYFQNSQLFLFAELFNIFVFLFILIGMDYFS